ncbi:AAA family ATPase [Alistipes senegalensis]|uniref:AAA family ATPase n=1 Tax=Alistipes senegalensis TaxID=1288121 RepID=UPI00101DAC2B|nr:ATP-binding protein [Alistipes senegalensis]
METPFIFGKIATEKNFTDREQETAYLVSHFTSLINTIIISPRRWGKSSLVNKAAKLAMEQDSKLRICHIDLFNVRNEEHFYSLLAQKVIAATSSKWEEAIGNAKKFFSRLVPKISIGTDPTNEVSIDFDWEEVRHNPDEILDLAEKIAKEKGLKIVICVDEFQNIAGFDDPEYFQKKLRSHWQLHQNVAYCLYGSKRHMMLEVFTDSSKPFYKFGNLIFLNKIETEYLVEFFSNRFADTGKSITSAAGQLIATLVDNHPYYAQQLAQLSWLRTKDECTEEIVREAHTALVEQLSLLFVTITETLTNQQLCYLKALIAEEKSITSTEVMHRYNISSPTSVARSKVALVKNDILDNQAGKMSFQDPIYAYWLKTQYFAK